MTDDAENPVNLVGGKQASRILGALTKAHDDPDQMNWRTTCEQIEQAYSINTGRGWWPNGAFFGEVSGDNVGNGLDLFWASFEVLKPAVYAKPPQPAVAAVFKDNDPVVEITAELLERTSTIALMSEDMDLKMQHIRDDVLFFGRGVLWVSYESKDGKQKACVEYVDRDDFRHEAARYWESVGWVAKRAWLTFDEAKARFGEKKAKSLNYSAKRSSAPDFANEGENYAKKVGVWEMWNRADERVYWVSEGCPDILDESEPMFEVEGFFPCPRPAYATTQLRTLIPIPDWSRYADHFAQINTLTSRIYTLLDMVKLKAFVAAGGDAADAVKSALTDRSDSIVVAVPGAGLTQTGQDLITWMPLDMIATTIQGLIEARTQLINDFYQLSGISDIMRGATEAQETLGAQQLKSQYGSVRVQEKVQELQRIAADVVKIIAQIAAQKFTSKTLLEMSQMDIRTQAQIDKRIREIEQAAADDLRATGKMAQEEAQKAVAQLEQAIASGQMQPEEAEQAKAQVSQQLEQQIQQAAQENNSKFGPQLQEAEQAVPMEAVMKLLRDDRVRGFTFEIESDSTILTDEMQEKSSRNEFMMSFVNSAQALQQIGMMGEEGADLVGAFLKFQTGPYRVGRGLETTIDKFVEALPRMAQQASEQGGEAQGMAELAEAEMAKAQAQMEKVKADSMLKQAELQARMAEMQQKAAENEQKQQLEMGKLQLAASKQEQEFAAKMADLDAKQNLMQAQTAKILAEIGLDVRRQDLEEYRATADLEMRAADQAMSAQNAAVDQDFRDRQSQALNATSSSLGSQ